MFTVTNVATESKNPPTNDEWADLLNQIAALDEGDQRAVYGALQEAVAPLVKGKTVANKLKIGGGKSSGGFRLPSADNDRNNGGGGFKLPKGE